MFGIKTRFYRKGLAAARGYRAGRRGDSLYQNPYKAGSRLSDYWIENWGLGQNTLYNEYYNQEVREVGAKNLSKWQYWTDNAAAGLTDTSVSDR